MGTVVFGVIALLGLGGSGGIAMALGLTFPVGVQPAPTQAREFLKRAVVLADLKREIVVSYPVVDVLLAGDVLHRSKVTRTSTRHAVSTSPR